MIPLFLDWDGVLVDSLQLYLELFQSICSEHDKFLPVCDTKGFREWYQPRWELNFYELGFSHQEYLELCRRYPATLDYSKAPFFPHVTENLRNWAQHHPLCIVSSAPTQNIVDRLEQSGLRGHFLRVTGSDDGSTSKVERLAELLCEFKTRSGVMVGDTEVDIEAARSNEILSVGVTYGWISVTRLLAARPDFIANHPDQLDRVIEAALQAAKHQKGRP